MIYDIKEYQPKLDEIVYCFCFEDYDQLAFYCGPRDWGDDEGIVHLFKSVHTHKYISVEAWMEAPKRP